MVRNAPSALASAQLSRLEVGRKADVLCSVSPTLGVDSPLALLEQGGR